MKQENTKPVKVLFTEAKTIVGTETEMKGMIQVKSDVQVDERDDNDKQYEEKVRMLKN